MGVTFPDLALNSQLWESPIGRTRAVTDLIAPLRQNWETCPPNISGPECRVKLPLRIRADNRDGNATLPDQIPWGPNQRLIRLWFSWNAYVALGQGPPFPRNLHDISEHPSENENNTKTAQEVSVVVQEDLCEIPACGPERGSRRPDRREGGDSTPARNGRVKGDFGFRGGRALWRGALDGLDLDHVVHRPGCRERVMIVGLCGDGRTLANALWL
jgi:hypothetical protein